MEELERITRLETQHSEMMRLLQETRQDMKDIHSDMHELKESLTKWKGSVSYTHLTLPTKRIV